MTNLTKALILAMVTALLCACEPAPEQTLEQVQLPEVNQVKATGEVDTAEQAIIAPPAIKRMWNYQIKFLAPENTQIKAGTVIVAFEDKQLRDRLIDKQASYSQAQKELENTVATLETTEEELKLDVAQKQMEYDKAKRRAEIVDQSRSENERKKTQIQYTIAQKDLALSKQKLAFHRDNKALDTRLAKNKVNRLAYEIKELEEGIAKLKVTAPIDGLVIYHRNNDGEKKSVGESVGFGEPVAKIAVLQSMRVKAQIDEADSGKLAIGQQVEITLDGSDEIHTTGTVAALGSVFREKGWQDKRKVIDALIEFNNMENEAIRPGLTARLVIHTQIREQG